MFKKLSPKARWRLGNTVALIGIVAFVIDILIYEYLNLPPTNIPYRIISLTIIGVTCFGVYILVKSASDYSKEIYDKNKLQKRHFIIKVCLSLFGILLIAGVPAGIITAVIAGVGELPGYVMGATIGAGFFIGMIGIWLTLKWGMPTKKQQNAHTDTLKFTSFEEFKLTAKNHYNSKCYETFYYADDSNPECVTAFYKNIDGKYIDLIFIADIKVLTPTVLDEELQDIFHNIITMINEKIPNCAAGYTTVILSPKNITDYFYEYLNKNQVLYKTYGTLLVTGLSFSERKVYISKMLEGHGLRGYKIILPLFCELMKIETPDFWKKKKRGNEDV